MKKQAVYCIVFIALFALLGSSLFSAMANFKPGPKPTINIGSDGNISPPSPLIQKNGAVYTLLGNLSNILEVECSNITIDGSGFSIFGNMAGNGITLRGVRNVTVSNFKVIDCNIDIFLNGSSNCRIEKNSLQGGNYGIKLYAAEGNLISNNSFTRSYCGICLDSSRENTLRNNIIRGEPNPAPIRFGLDFLVIGSAVSHYQNDIDSSNTITGRPIYYWVSRQDAIVPQGVSYIALIGCKNITVQNQDLYNTQGILLAWTANSTVVNNSVHGSLFGIQLLSSANDTISGNQISDNTGLLPEGGDGISLINSTLIGVADNNVLGNWNGGITCSGSSGNRIIGNAISDNRHNGINLVNNSDYNVIALNHLFDHSTQSHAAVFIQDSVNNYLIANNLTNNGCWGMQLIGAQQNNTLYFNNFVNNSYSNVKFNPGVLQVSFTGVANPNYWDNGTFGNYWSDYATRYPNASTLNDSATIQTPFEINQNNIDHYPLLKPFNTSDVPALPSPSGNVPSITLPATPPHPTSSPTPTNASTVTIDVSIISPLNNSFFNVSIEGVGYQLIYQTNTTLSWVGYSIGGSGYSIEGKGSGNVTVSENGTWVRDFGSSGYHTLTLYANDTSGNWASPQTVTYLVNFYPDYPPTSSPSPTQQPRFEPSPTWTDFVDGPNLLPLLTGIIIMLAIGTIGAVIYFKRGKKTTDGRFP